MMKKLTWIGLAGAVAASLTGCGDKGAGESGGDTPSTKQVTLKMMHNWTNPNIDNEILKARIELFQKENPDIKIDVEEVPSSQYLTKLQTQATGRTLPDLAVYQPNAALQPFVNANLLMPIDEILDTWKDILPQEAIDSYSLDGKHYAVPAKLTYVDIIYYNKDLLSKVGYTEFPQTYDKFIDMVKKLRAADITPIVVGNKDRWPLQSSYISILSDRFGGSDFLTKAAKGEAKFTDPEFVKALQVIEELTALNAFNADMNTIDTVQEQNFFLQGKAAMSITTSTVDAKYRQSNENGDNIGIALYPSFEGGKGEAGVSAGNYQFGVGLSIDLEKDPAKKEAALKFLKFFYSKSLYEDLYKEGIIVPAKMDGAQTSNAYLQEIVALTSGKGTGKIFDQTLSKQVSEVLQNGLQSITIKQKTAEQVAKEMQAEQDKLNK